MSVKAWEKYQPNASSPSPQYPYGSLRQETALGVGDGTPLDVEWGNDFEAFKQTAFSRSGLVPSGNTDTVTNSEMFNAMQDSTTRSLWERSAAESGHNLVDGSFEEGGTLVNTNDVLWSKKLNKIFSGPAGVVAAGTDPTSGGFVDVSPMSPGAGVIRDGRFALRDAVSLADYDDVFDGVKDNTVAMQKAVNTGRPVMLPNGTIRITVNIDFSSVAGVDIFAPFIGTTLLVDLPNGAYFLSNKDYATRGESKVKIQGVQIRQVNPLSRLFYVEKTYSPVLFEDLILLDSINCFDFVDLYGNPTVRRIKVRNSSSLGGAGDFLFRATGCNTFVLDNFTGNAGAFDGVMFLNNTTGSANYNNSLNNITIQGSASSNRRAIYYQGGDCVITNVYEEGRSSTQSIFLDGVKSAKLGAIHMTGGSIHTKDSNVYLSSVSFLKVNAAKADISAITSDNSNIVIGVINNNQDYDYRFERESSGSIKVLKDKNLRGRPIATKRLTQQNPINADATVTTDTTLAPLGIDFRYRVVTNGISDTGIRLVVDGSGNLPAGTRITAVARIQTTDNSLVRFEKNSGDITARYYFPTSTRCDKTGDHVCILHLVATGNSFNGNVNVKTTSATTFYVYGEVYPGWVYID